MAHSGMAFSALGMPRGNNQMLLATKNYTKTVKQTAFPPFPFRNKKKKRELHANSSLAFRLSFFFLESKQRLRGGRIDSMSARDPAVRNLCEEGGYEGDCWGEGRGGEEVG